MWGVRFTPEQRERIDAFAKTAKLPRAEAIRRLVEAGLLQAQADGITTRYARDYLGRITSITRGTRVWEYGFDLNGNLTSSRSPRPAGALATDYTVQYVYDPLDRIVRRRPGSRGPVGRAASARHHTIG